MGKKTSKLQYKIIEGHWSTDPDDNRTQDDEDSTYIVVDDKDKSLDIFNTYAQAKSFIQKLIKKKRGKK